jgi:hypothetical protein
MTSLIDGHTVLKSSPAITCPNGIVYRYRLTLASDQYHIHEEYKEPYGACGEMIMYKGNDLEKANYAFDALSRSYE